MLNPTTPGVSVEEITKLPNSVALIDTAMPVFIGYTDKIPAGYDINSSINKKLKISSLLEFEDNFGKAKKENIQLKDIKDKGVTLITPDVQFLMYYSLQMYFANGGGPCYIISVGTYDSASQGVQLSSLKNGLDKVEIFEAIKEPILILFPDAVSLDETDFYDLYNYTIDEKLGTEGKNRFAIFDTYEGHSAITSNNLNTIGHFRAQVTNPTSHAAAYFPHLTTILNYTFDETDVAITHTGLQQPEESSATFYEGQLNALEGLKTLASAEILSESTNPDVLADLLSHAVAIAEEINETADDNGQPDGPKAVLVDAIDEAKHVLNAIHEGIIDNFDIPEDFNEGSPIFSGEFEDLITAIKAVRDEKGDADGKILKDLQSSNSALYNQIKREIASLQVVLPPSSAMAGVYGRIDNTRGVWKAPANLSLNYVVAPTEKVSEQEQSDLNIDDTGKSINAIRTFTGKGTLVWGARTLDGKDKKDNIDNEWKYIHVRRYYDMLEQSIGTALRSFINEPNILTTWLRAKTMLENFLNQQWMDGALAGSNPSEAYEVKVYGEEDPDTHVITNTMIVEIKVALVRPAEFIILKFSHKLQQS
ncbi:phage tail sheath family protein [Chryseobacterium sp. MMS23-Vi53]|uniref:phage tail sheath family protein n=1 Tax=Chryseobacterium sp. MMS23-Vi53 TaxID=3386644 RepID=UPI0039ED3B31